MAQHGLSTVVLERGREVGGACRTEELTLPGFRHDVGSAVHPLGLGSPFFSSLPLYKYGLTWIQPEIPLAHPVSREEVAVLRRSISDTAHALGRDGGAYRKLFEPLVLHWENLWGELLQPIIHFPRHPLLATRFCCAALLSIEQLLRHRFSQRHARALLAGLGTLLPTSYRRRIGSIRNHSGDCRPRSRVANSAGRGPGHYGRSVATLAITWWKDPDRGDRQRFARTTVVAGGPVGCHAETIRANRRRATSFQVSSSA